MAARFYCAPPLLNHLPGDRGITKQGVGVRYAYAVTVSIKRALQPPPVGPGGRLFGFAKRSRPLDGDGVSTTELHVAFTVLSDGLGVSSWLHGRPAGEGDGDAERGVGLTGDGSGAEEGWGMVATADLEVERLST